MNIYSLSPLHIQTIAHLKKNKLEVRMHEQLEWDVVTKDHVIHAFKHRVSVKSVSLSYNDATLYRYWPGQSWNITFRWTPREFFYIFPRDYIFPKCTALRENIVQRENITLLAPPTHDISSVLVDICYIWWSKISSKFNGALWLPWSLVTRLGICVENKLSTNLTALHASYYDVLLLTLRTLLTRCISFWVSFLIWNWCYCCCWFYFLLNCYIFPVGQYNSVLNYMSKLYLIFWDISWIYE